MAKYTTLAETAQGMSSDDWKERLIAEYYQVKIRYETLLETCKNKPKAIPEDHYPYLETQLGAMKAYQGCLALRCNKLGVDLD